MKNFWKAYFNYYRRNIGYFWCSLVIYILLWTVLSFFVKSMSGVFVGSFFGDVFSFWFWTYPKIKKGEVAKCQHEPLLEINGRKIYGTKCCSKCGLNEAYWNI